MLGQKVRCSPGLVVDAPGHSDTVPTSICLYLYEYKNEHEGLGPDEREFSP